MFNLRNKIKILIKITKPSSNQNIAELSKVNSIISQYGIEDTTLLDLYIFKNFKFFKNKNYILPSYEFYAPIEIFIFRDELDTQLNFFNFNLNSIIKFLLDKKYKIQNLANLYNYFQIINLSYRKNFYLNFFFFYPSLKSILKSFKRRNEMKDRKINFRRKIKQNTFND